MEIILGVLVSLASQLSKKIFGTGEYQTLGTVAVLSLAASGVYVLFGHSEYWDTVVQILTTAGAFYTFIIARFPKASNTVVSE